MASASVAVAMRCKSDARFAWRQSGLRMGSRVDAYVYVAREKRKTMTTTADQDDDDGETPDEEFLFPLLGGPAFRPVSPSSSSSFSGWGRREKKGSQPDNHDKRRHRSGVGGKRRGRAPRICVTPPRKGDPPTPALGDPGTDAPPREKCPPSAPPACPIIVETLDPSPTPLSLPPPALELDTQALIELGDGVG